MVKNKFKVCSKCDKEKFISCFNKDKNTKDKLHCWCRDCRKLYYQKYDKEYYWKNKLKIQNKGIEKRYNITLEQYDQMFEQQNGNCVICGLPELMCRLSVDHNHKTGEIRSLLCRKCNLLVGNIENNKELLKRIFNYLKINEFNS